MSYVQAGHPCASNFSHFSPLFSFHFSSCLHPKFEFQKLSPLFFPSLPPGFFSLPPSPWRSSLLFSQPRLCLQHSHYSASPVLTRVDSISSDYPKIHKSLSASTTHTLLWAFLKAAEGVNFNWLLFVSVEVRSLGFGLGFGLDRLLEHTTSVVPVISLRYFF